MSENYSHSKHLSAEEIQAYLKADLSEQEMHLIERHLLECEFCSEAMEGYETSISSANIREEIINLNERIDKRTKQKKKKRVFPIIRVAAIALALIVSAIFITNYFVADIKNPEFSEKKEVVKEKVDGEEEGEVSEGVKEGVNEEVKGEVKGEGSEGVKKEVNGEVIKEVKGEVKEDVMVAGEDLEEMEKTKGYANFSIAENTISVEDADVNVEGSEVEMDASNMDEDLAESEIIVATRQDKKSNNLAGRLKGTIRDSLSNEPIPFAMVTVISGESVIAGTTTDFDGKYDFQDVTSSDYTIEISSVGYTKKMITDAIINAGKITFLDVQMIPGNDLETVDVVAYSVPLIDKDGGSSGGTVTSEDISKMPLKDATSTSSTVAGVESQGKRKRLKKSKKRYSSASFGEGEKAKDDSFDAYPNIGLDAFNTYLSDSIDYPIEAKEKGIKGIVIIKITVNINGEITDYKVVKSLAHGCDEEAIRLIEKGPYWIAANKKGEPISSTIKVEVTFE